MAHNPRAGEAPPILKLVQPFQKFIAREASGGVVLLACTLIALAWANSPWEESYVALWHAPVSIGVGGYQLDRDLHFWVNDALMSFFFFVVGLEIKREMLAGELASARRAVLPIVAAIGGVVAPALLYSALNAGGPGAGAWGIPMATDIAFAIGVMALLGDRVPLGLKIFLTALAIVDDIAAVLVIAIFHTTALAWVPLGAAILIVLLAAAANRLGVRHPLPYVLLGAALWVAVLESGVHATLGGVLLAFTIPASAVIGQSDFARRGRAVLDHFEDASRSEPYSILSDIEQQNALHTLEDLSEKMQPPLHRLEHALHPWVTFAVMPLFALANAGVKLSTPAGILSEPIALGVIIGLLLGKPAGITLAAWVAVRLRWAALPDRVSWRQIFGVGWLAGIGFTMSFFMASLALPDDAGLAAAKLGVLVASVLAGVIGSAILMKQVRLEKPPFPPDLNRGKIEDG